MPISRHVRMIRTAISPRFAIRTFGLLAARVLCLPWTSEPRALGMLIRDDLLAALERDRGRCSRAFRGGYRFDEWTAMELAGRGSAEWTLVAAAHQTDGRGRLGRSGATSPRVAACARSCSACLLPPGGVLSLLAGACMAGRSRTVRQTGDLQVAERPDGREEKVGGILLESAVDDDVLRYVVVGIGVNMQSPADVEGAGGIGERVGMRELLSAFLVRFAGAYTTDDASLPERVRPRGSRCPPRSVSPCARPRRRSHRHGPGRGHRQFRLAPAVDRRRGVARRLGEIEHLRPA